jgi:hypothetical protein
MMDERRDQELRAADRAHLDGRRQEDMGWFEGSGRVPMRQKGPSEGVMGSFEKHPMLWAIVVLMMGALAFFLVTRILV